MYENDDENKQTHRPSEFKRKDISKAIIYIYNGTIEMNNLFFFFEKKRRVVTFIKLR